MDHLKPSIILDLGSGYIKAGTAESEFPSCSIPTRIFSSNEEEDPVYPIEHGIIQNYEHIETLIGQIYDNELNLRPEEHPVLLTQPPKNPQKDKEKLAEILFENFQAPALYEEVHSVLTFYASGKSAGLILESGHGLTSVVPILSGYAISEAILRLDVGGGEIDKYLANFVNEKQPDNPITNEEARILKENLCYVPEESNFNHRDAMEESYRLPDGRTITLEKERQIATNPLFDPSLVDQYDAPGIHEMIFQSIFKCGVDLRRDFANNIILSGGNTMFSGLDVRLKHELESRVPPSMTIHIIADPDRKVYVWRGGSILASLSTFIKNICLSRQEYEEFGASILRKKFINGL
ncbi:hypothetical protein ABEB36_014682 [Hypothenemus hampei]|uniref:Actin n=1 Tax=Hypothenemus hampei TaxID=57062 RepID=A0ABD1E3G5_HYPHA